MRDANCLFVCESFADVVSNCCWQNTLFFVRYKNRFKIWWCVTKQWLQQNANMCIFFDWRLQTNECQCPICRDMIHEKKLLRKRYAPMSAYCSWELKNFKYMRFTLIQVSFFARYNIMWMEFANIWLNTVTCFGFGFDCTQIRIQYLQNFIANFFLPIWRCWWFGYENVIGFASQSSN